jgi:ATP-dependent Zn protease
MRTYAKRSFVALSLALSCTYATTLFADKALPNYSENSTQLIKSDTKLTEAQFKDGDDLFNLIECILSDLATFIQEDAVTIDDKTKKEAVKQAIISTLKAIFRERKMLHNTPTIGQLQKAVTLLEQLIAHLGSYLDNDITAYQAFDIDAYRVRSVAHEDAMCSPISIQTSLEAVKQKLTKTKKQAENTGLTLVNHLYRNTLDRFVIQPCDKYNLHWKALYVTAAVAGVAYLWYKLNKSTDGLTADLKGEGDNSPYTTSYKPETDSYLMGLVHRAHDWGNYQVRYWMGWTPEGPTTPREVMLQNALEKEIVTLKEQGTIAFNNYDTVAAEKIATRIQALSDAIKLHRPTTLFGDIEKATFDALQGHWYLGTALLWQPFRDSLFETTSKYAAKVKKFFVGIHNRLKGGAYYQRYKNKKGTLGRIEPRYTFDDIIGLEHAKEKLGSIINYMENPEGYDRAGLAPAKGYLLIGPARTGKTMLAEAVAGELKRVLGDKKDLPFFPIEARWIASEGNFDTLLRIAREFAPCVIFIDEIDMLNLHREKYKEKTVLLSEFLSTLSGCMNTDPDKQVIIIAATNSPENLDKSLLERFAQHIAFDYPSFLNRAEFFISALEGKGLPIDQFDIRKLSDQTEGCSFEKLHRIINHAQFTTRQQGRAITQQDIERSLDTELHNIIYQDHKDLSEDDMHTLAVHMAGHALAYTLIESNGLKLSQVTIRPVSTKAKDTTVLSQCLQGIVLPHILYGHIFTHHVRDSLKFISRAEMERLCMVELAGHVAESLLIGSHCIAEHTCSNYDKSKAFYWARKYHLNGLDEKLIEKSQLIQDELTKNAYTFMQECEDKVRELLQPRLELIKLVAEGLKKFETLGHDEMKAFVEIHTMLNGRTIEEFVKDMEEEQAALDTEQATEPKAEDAQTDNNIIRAAVREELGIEEIIPEAAVAA